MDAQPQTTQIMSTPTTHQINQSPSKGGKCAPTAAKKPKLQHRQKKKNQIEPTKPMSAYALFSNDFQAAINEKNSNVSFGIMSTKNSDVDANKLITPTGTVSRQHHIQQQHQQQAKQELPQSPPNQPATIQISHQQSFIAQQQQQSRQHQMTYFETNEPAGIYCILQNIQNNIPKRIDIVF